jgi:hypothetical protein
MRSSNQFEEGFPEIRQHLIAMEMSQQISTTLRSPRLMSATTSGLNSGVNFAPPAFELPS